MCPSANEACKAEGIPAYIDFDRNAMHVSSHYAGMNRLLRLLVAKTWGVPRTCGVNYIIGGGRWASPCMRGRTTPSRRIPRGLGMTVDGVPELLTAREALREPNPEFSR